MHFASLFAAALLGLARGQDEMPGQNPTGPQQQVHIVTMARNDQNRTGNFFSPEVIKAQAGDVVQFQFRGGNHTVTQAMLDKPCVPMENGIFSGYQDVAPNSRVKTFDLRINDTKPIWFYCSQGKHCQNGMVGAINAAADKMEQFKEAAKKAQGSSVTDSPSSPSSTVGAANSQYVLEPAVMLFALGAALMLL